MVDQRGQIRPDQLTGGDLPAQMGRYRVFGILGEGGMARVFLAELVGSGGFRKQCALKVIHRSILGEDESTKRLLINEAKLGGLLKHPNIVDTYDCGEIDGQPFIAMELVRGAGVDELIAAEGALPTPIALGIAIQMCSALDHAHNLVDGGRPANLVHRDLKPSNVMIGREGQVKLLDFGIAKASILTGATTRTGMTKGTPQYMSPEQLHGKPLDRRSDIFALGAILYELVTGERLFQADTLGAIVMQIVMADVSLTERGVWRELDATQPDVAAVIRKCVRIDPDQRWADVMEVRSALRALPGERADSEDIRTFVRNRLPADALTTDSEGSPVAAYTPDGTTQPHLLPTATMAEAPSQPTMPERPTAGPTRPMQRPRMAIPLPWIAAASGALALAVGLVWVLVPGREAAAPDAAPSELGEAASGVEVSPVEPATQTPEPIVEASPVRAEPEAAAEPTPAPPPRVEPTPEPPALSIARKRLPTMAKRTGQAVFEVALTGSESASAQLRYRLEGEVNWHSLPMTRAGDIHRAVLTLSPAMVGRYEYYAVAMDGGKLERLPEGASVLSLDVK